MMDQLFELSRKAAESSLQMQQVFFKQWTQAMLSASPATVGISADWGGTMRRRWVELMLDTLNKQREMIDNGYKTGIQTIERLAQASDAKSAEGVVRAMESAWSKMFEGYKAQAEAQFRDFQAWAMKSFEMAHKGTAT